MSIITLTTTGTTGPSTLNTSTGAMNIPNYADTSHLVLTANNTTGLSTFNSSTGLLNIPNYADVSKLVLTTNGGGGGATLTSGVLNVPIYAPAGVLNQVQSSTSSTLTTANPAPNSTGLGVAFQAVHNASALIIYVCYSSCGARYVLYAYRTTGSIPVLNAAVGTDVQVMSTGLYPGGGGSCHTSGIIYDTTLTIGTPYNYYVAFSSPTGTNTLTLTSIVLQVTEAK